MKAIVKTVAELREALRDQSWIEIQNDLYFESEADCFDVAEIRDPALVGQFLTICGPGAGYRGAMIWRMFDSDRPLIRFAHTNRRQWDWELRLRGIGFAGNGRQGSSLDIEYMQLSIFDDVDFRNHLSEPYWIRDGSVNKLLHVGHFYNARPGQFLNQSDFEIRGGNVHSDWGSRNAGMNITGAPHDPPPNGNSIGGPGIIAQHHNEGCKVKISNVRRLRYEGGYHLASTVELVNCVSSSVSSIGATWCNSVLIKDGTSYNINNV